MDHDTSNSPGKAGWREKLGLGTGAKTMPKIADEFKPARPTPTPDPDPEPKPRSEAERPRRAGRGERQKPQPVARPAPMAPRPQQQAKPQPQAKPEPGSPLSERLKAQRQAAEKLAEQRILAARAAKGDQKPSDKPKFSFAEEEIAQAKREGPAEQKRDYQPVFASRPGSDGGAKPPPAGAPGTLPPLVPPRPALGGERPITPQPGDGRALPGANFPPRHQAGALPPSGYRPLDPPNYPARQQPPGPPPRPAAYGNGAYPEGRIAPPRAYDSYRRPPPGGAVEADEAFRGRRSRTMPARGRMPGYEDEFGEAFEDEAPPRRRASAQDYHQAYRDYADDYDHDERRRSTGPWLIALALLVFAMLATAGWYYFYFMKPSQVSSAEVPVISAPDKPAKSEPEPSQQNASALGTSGNQSALDGSPDRRKQIYDRVLGDDTAEGNKIVPTQEQPQQIEPAGDQPPQQTQGALPQPSAQGNSGAGTSQSTEPLPLPLPPPPGSSSDQQGSVNPTASDRVAAFKSSTENSQATAQPAAANDMIAPIPGEADAPTKGSAIVPQSPAQPVEKSVEELPAKKTQVAAGDDAPAARPPEPSPAKPAKLKSKAAKAQSKKKATSPAVEEISAPEPTEPIMPPPSQAATQQTPATQPATMPDQAAAATPQPEKKSGSFFDFLDGSGKPTHLTGKRADQPDFSNSSSLNTAAKPASEEVPATDQQVAAISPDQQPQPQPIPAPEPTEPKAQAGGYLAQLASFRSEADAMAEFNRLRVKYGDLVGSLSPRVTKASVSGTTRYRLGVGPVASREAAARICNSLIAAGERDCLVRGN
jgi:cell division septation protein DedD